MASNTITMIRGDTVSFTVYLRQGKDVVPFTQGDTIHFTVRYDPDCCNKIIEKIVTNFDEQGRAVFKLDNSDTQHLAPTPNTGRWGYFYDVQWTDAQGNRITIIASSILRLIGDITHE